MENQDSLFDLCKQVYEKTGWKDTFAVYEQTDGIPLGTPYVAYPELERRFVLWGTQEMKKQTPLYTSDYLLEKLPKAITSFYGKSYPLSPQVMASGKYFYAMYKHDMAGLNEDVLEQQAETPLKALLKLTLALSEAGEL